MQAYDVLIVGGGVIGSAIAYFLAACERFDGRVLVVERDASYRDCSTARSVGGIRQQFSTPENMQMSLFGAQFIKGAAEHLSVDGEAPTIDFVEAGYLTLASPSGRDALEANHAVQQAHGAEIALLSPEELSARFPWLRTDDLAGGTLGLSHEGWLDPYGLLQGFRRKARSLGVHYVQDEVSGMARAGRRIVAARLRSGRELGCGHLVNAAGPRARQVAALAGVDIPVSPRKRCVFAFDCREKLPRCPLTIDPAGLYFRPEGPSYICGISPRPSEDPDCEDFDLEVEYGWFEERLWPMLAHRVPAFEALKMTNAWAGHYAYNTFDQNAILGPHPEVENLMLANGFSGHGLQQSPAVGRAISELIAFGEYRSLDLSRFGYARILQGRPVRELNVV
ncbi:MAG: FAD-binding oxidoreductase [Gammaproteobacteria bacterium]|nr:FAD-binding oxidoreductase [Gammaproteobacteria bacterium]NIR83057.1 FAD-binding oxidoreductase [Gammaproteobacteria bacterium]NIR90719.1 FAD-binding oxidoreductase [Gammaproteobacteria bacterium]NIU04210.1 FAD-binding oxidoreductase [Gammaproteobacteria bacterium]NIV51502.1 FAD-dependent oxidoreductase [Gammaproteobacteria bacterium]